MYMYFVLYVINIKLIIKVIVFLLNVFYFVFWYVGIIRVVWRIVRISIVEFFKLISGFLI